MTTSSRNFATSFGSLSLVLWAVEPLLVSELEGFPIFQSLTLVFVSCFLVTIVHITLKRRWHLILQQKPFVWVFGVLAICGSDFAYMLGAFNAPIAHVDLIDYLWPCLLVFIIGFLPNKKFEFKYIISAILGLLAVIILLTNNEGLAGFNTNYTYGYLLALFGVIIWGAYTVYSSCNLTVPPDMMGIYCGFGAIVTFTLHLSLEQTVMPTWSQANMAILLGLAGPGLAYQLWDYGVKYGNARMLSVLCYVARVAGVALLVLFGKQELSEPLILACGIALFAVLCSSINLTRASSIFFRQLQKFNPA